MRKRKFVDLIASVLAQNRRRRKEIPADIYSPMHIPNLFISTQRNRSLLHLLRRERLTALGGERILDVGCGSGGWLLDFVAWGATPELICGIDVDEKQVAGAGRKLPSADVRVGNAAQLPWQDSYFDIVLQATVFSSILDLDVRKAIAVEMMRVTKPGGLIIWYDSRFDNPWNPRVRGIPGREVRELFPGCSFRLKRVTLLPPLARRIVPVTWIVSLLLEKVPILRTHILGSVRLPRPAIEPNAFADNRDDTVIQYSPITSSLVNEVVDLHVLCFRDFFLTGLGRGMLTRYYSHYDSRADSICFVALSRCGKVVGLVAGSRNYGEFLRTFYRAHFLALAFAVTRSLFRSADLRRKLRQRIPNMKGAIKSLFQSRRSKEARRTSGGFAPDETGGLASAAVHPDFRTRGVALELYRLFEERAKKLGVRRLQQSVLSSNTGLVLLYRMTGWRVTRGDENYVDLEKIL